MSRICRLFLYLVLIVLIKSDKSSLVLTNNETEKNALNNVINAIENLSTQMQMVKDDLEYMNLRMDFLDRRIQDFKFEQQSKGYEYIYGDQSKNDQSTILTSPNQNFDELSLQQNVSNFLEIFRKQNTKLTENVSKLQLLLNGNLFSKFENELSIQKYDKHFNCLKNCSFTEKLPKSCAEATRNNGFKDDVYLLNVSSSLEPFYAFCNLKKAKEKAWTIIQRREDGSVNFDRNWLDYKHGFGNLYGEHWIGLERLHAMTKAQPHELWIYLRAYGGENRHANYKNFSIASENDGYKLTLGGYSGDSGDSFGEQANMKFSTYDKNNDLSEFGNCAQKYKGGWWYKNCYHCNLNGVFYSVSNKNSGNSGIIWIKWLGYDTSLKYSSMAIRPL